MRKRRPLILATPGSIEAAITLFASAVDNAITAIPTPYEKCGSINSNNTTKTRGIDALLRWRQEPFVITASYLVLDATEQLDETSATASRTHPKTIRWFSRYVGTAWPRPRGH